MKKVLFVCLGNICRSPLAQGIFEKKVSDEKLGEYFYADSAGTSGWHKGEKPQSGSIMAAGKKDINISSQKSRPVSHGDNVEFDFFIPMDKSNRLSLINEFSIPEEKIHLLRKYDPKNEDLNVPDPYSMGQGAFDEVFNIIERCMPDLIKFLNEKV
jgi:protein-tyrosine phosphatase